VPDSILCVAGSPSIDKLFEIEHLVPGAIHRPERFIQVPGGKGLNVARAVATLGQEVVATGLLAGPSGRWIEEELSTCHVTGRFVWTEGQTRSSLSVSDRATGALTEFYEADTAGTPDAWERVQASVEALLPDASWCVLSGTLPQGAPRDGYSRLIRAARKVGALTALDVRGEPLGDAVDTGPALVKINAAEAEELVSHQIADVEGATRAAREIRKRAGGAGHAVAITLGIHGAVLVDPEGACSFGRLQARGRYPVGCGDAFLAGLLVARCRGESWRESLAWGLGVAAANAELPGAGRFGVERAAELTAAARAVIDEPLRA
jgi:1-phosphofructokinase family hexose kinase